MLVAEHRFHEGALGGRVIRAQQPRARAVRHAPLGVAREDADGGQRGQQAGERIGACAAGRGERLDRYGFRVDMVGEA